MPDAAAPAAARRAAVQRRAARPRRGHRLGASSATRPRARCSCSRPRRATTSRRSCARRRGCARSRSTPSASGCRSSCRRAAGSALYAKGAAVGDPRRGPTRLAADGGVRELGRARTARRSRRRSTTLAGQALRVLALATRELEPRRGLRRRRARARPRLPGPRRPAGPAAARGRRTRSLEARAAGHRDRHDHRRLRADRRGDRAQDRDRHRAAPGRADRRRARRRSTTTRSRRGWPRCATAASCCSRASRRRTSCASSTPSRRSTRSWP